MGCGRWECRPCAERKINRRARAIAAALPTRFITLTGAAQADDPRPWVTARERTKDLIQIFRRDGVDFGEYCWTLEHNPSGTGYHLHMHHRGGYISQRLLSRNAVRAGFGKIVDIRKISNPNASAGYALKLGAYGVKSLASTEPPWGSLSPLAANGGRLEHHSRGFFGPGGVAQAERAAAIVFSGPGRWVVGSLRYLRNIDDHVSCPDNLLCQHVPWPER